MKRTWLAVFALALSLYCVPSSAQWNGCRAGFCAPGTVSAPTYQGPGDIVAFAHYWALNAYSAAKRGTAVVNACNSTGGVDVACADLSTDSVTGILVAATIGGITCPGANCTVKTIYDQVAGSSVTNPTISTRGNLTTNCLGTLACIACSSGTCQYAGAITTIAQPYSFLWLGERTSAFTTFGSAFGATIFASYRAAANTFGLNAGTTSQTATVSDSAFHAITISVPSGGIPTFNVDGTSTTAGSTAGTSATGTAWNITNNASNGFIGQFVAHGIISSALTPTQQTNLCHNMFAFWGTPTSC